MASDSIILARAIGSQHADKRLSASFDFPPGTLMSNAAELINYYGVDMDSQDRSAAIANFVDQYIFPDVEHQAFQVFSWPKPGKLNGKNITIGSLGDDISAGAAPIAVPTDYFYGSFASLVPRADVDKFRLPADPVDPATIPGPDVDKTAGAPPSLERLNAGTNEVALTSLPFMLGVPKGVSIPTALPFADLDEDFGANWPLFPVWAKSVIHCIKYNDGISMAHGGPLFSLDSGDACPTKEFFAPYRPLGSIKNAVLTLGHHDASTVAFRNHFKDKSEDMLFRVGLREIAHGRIPSAFQAAAAPVASGSSLPPGATVVPPNGDAIASAITRGIEATIAATVPTIMPRSLSDIAQTKAAQSLVYYFQLMGAAEQPDSTGSVIVPAELNPEFKNLIETKRGIRQMEEFAELLRAHTRNKKASNKLHSVYSNITLVADSVKGPLGATFLNGSMLTTPLTTEPEKAKNQFSILACTTPRPNSDIFQEYLRNGELVQAQELVDEHSSKRERKATELCIDGKVGSDTSCMEAICNLFCLYSFAILNFEQSILWNTLLQFIYTITSAEAKAFYHNFPHDKQIYLHLLIAVQTVLRNFHEVASTMEYKHAVRDGSTLMTTIFQNTIAAAKQQLMRINLDFTSQHLDFLKPIPKVAKLFPQLRLGEKAASKPAPSSGYEPPAKRSKGAPPNQERSNSGQQPKGNTMKQDELEQKKQVGFLTYSKTGTLPPLNIYYPTPSGNNTRLCLNHIIRGRFCRWGTRCTFHHPTKLGDIPEDERRVLQKNVETTDGLAFVPGLGPPVVALLVITFSVLVPCATNELEYLTIPDVILPGTTVNHLHQPHPFAHPMTGTCNYHTLPPDPSTSLAIEDYPAVPFPVFSSLVQPQPPDTNPTPCPVGRPYPRIPTLNQTFKQSQLDNFARKHLAPYVVEMLNNPFGKDNLCQTFNSEAALRHVLLPLWKSGFLFACDDDWHNLAIVYAPARDFLAMWNEYGNVDFNALRGFPQGVLDATDFSVERMRMATAALLHFDGNLATLTRWMGGPHTGEHRNHKQLLERWKPVLRDHTYRDLKRILLCGAPAKCNASASERNFQLFLRYGNHVSANQDRDKTKKAIVKDTNRGYAIPFDPRMVSLAPHVHVTPHGVIDLDHPYKDPRPVFDGSFRPEPWADCVNDWVHKQDEPPVYFADTFLLILIWIWNLRITYPLLEILLGEDDCAGAFRHAKHHPNLVGMHCAILLEIMIAFTGQTFGSTGSPGNWEPFANARQQIAQHIWALPDLVAKAAAFLPPIELAPSPTLETIQTFVKAEPDSKNRGVLDAMGNRLPPPFVHHVDDNLYADVPHFMRRTIAASILSLFEVLGYPTENVQIALSLNKFLGKYNHERKMLGFLVNSRTMTVELLPSKREHIVQELALWLTKQSYTLREAVQLLGLLEHMSRYTKWGRVWFHGLQNAVRRIIRQRGPLALRQFQKSGQAERLARALPAQLAFRLDKLVRGAQARVLWHSNFRISLSEEVHCCLSLLHSYLRIPSNSWAAPIANIVPRDPHFECFGDASTSGAGGGWCRRLQFWFEIDWSPKTIARTRLNQKDPAFLHINCLEFLVVILQLTAVIARLQSLPRALASEWFPEGVPLHPVVLIWTDNTAAKSWANRVSSSSVAGQNLLGIYAALLKRFQIGVQCDHIPGERNIIADFISRPDHPFYTFRQRADQIFQKHPLLKTYTVFQPSREILQLLASSLCTKPVQLLPELPSNLGQFATVESTASSSSSTCNGLTIPIV